MDKINTYLDTLPEWQKSNLELFRKLVHDAEPSIVEDWKWNVPVFIHNGSIYFAMSAFKQHTKYNFMINGAQLTDPTKLFNNGFDSKKSRGIDLRQGDTINTDDLTKLIKASLDY
jgi:hypothetical protein